MDKSKNNYKAIISTYNWIIHKHKKIILSIIQENLKKTVNNESVAPKNKLHPTLI